MEPLIETKQEEKSTRSKSPPRKRVSLAQRFNRNGLTIALVEKDESRVGAVKKMDQVPIMGVLEKQLDFDRFRQK